MAVTVFGVGGANTSVKEVKLLTVKLLEFLLVRAALLLGHGECPLISG
ncbi:hypothetical protein [Peribacillus simplex]|nr:hypothetical protein [Peribacillus simplex]MDR4929328.1 hypothetical protein [Peribacillus simplex]WHX90916.1 hypothetical protein QNH50_23680 [Peribacillus simplex]